MLERAGERLELRRSETKDGNRDLDMGMGIPRQRRQSRFHGGTVRLHLPQLRFGFIGALHIRLDQRRSAEQVFCVGPSRHQVRESAQKSQRDFQIGYLWRGVHGKPWDTGQLRESS